MVRDLTGKRAEYYEAILQLREISKETKEFVDKEIYRVKLPISKINKLKNGFDYYLADNEMTRALGKRLQQKIGGELTITASLHTKIKGKDVYRVTVLFREAHFRKDDEIEYQGESFVVKAMSKDIFIQHTKTGKKAHVKYKDMKRMKKV